MEDVGEILEEGQQGGLVAEIPEVVLCHFVFKVGVSYMNVG